MTGISPTGRALLSSARVQSTHTRDYNKRQGAAEKVRLEFVNLRTMRTLLGEGECRS